MITYWVRFQTFDGPQNTQTDPSSPLDNWQGAKQRRNSVFEDSNIRACWIEQINRVKDGDLFVELTKQRFGNVLARRKAKRESAS